MMMPILGAPPASLRRARESLADALFTRTRQRVLRALFGQPDRSYYASELIASPLFPELRNIVLKTVGLAEPRREAVEGPKLWVIGTKNDLPVAA